MKKLLHVMLGLSLFLTACDEAKEIVVVNPGLRLTPPVPIVFSAEGGEKRLAVITNQPEWTATSDQTWCQVKVVDGAILITAAKTESRTDLPVATVTVTAGKGGGSADDITASVSVNQTAVPPVIFKKEEPSNCYVVLAKGVYRFYAGFRGRSTTPTTDQLQGCTADWAWMTSDGLITVEPQLSDDGYITFYTSETSYNQGNAVIALLQDGKVIWTWHIWVTDCIQDLGDNPFMNVNLGATSNAPGSAESLGLYYQWGRKDPFIGAAGTGDVGVTSYNETTPFAAGTENGVSYTAHSVVNPAIAAAWNVDGSNTKYKLETLATLPTTYVGQWGSSPNYEVMTWPKEADPCPTGWHIPSYSEMAANMGSPQVNFSIYWGMIQGGNNYWPATGYRHTYIPYTYNGRLNGVGQGAIYWSGSQRKDVGFAAGILFSFNGIEVNDFMITYGLSTRCIKNGVY